MDSNDYVRFRLEELITRREAMIAENKQREHLGQSMAYVEKQFNELADEMRQFAEKA